MFFSISLIVILVLILMIVILGFVLLYKLKKILGVSSISSFIKQVRSEGEEIPKALSGMDSLCLPRIKEDFPELNINELKRECEKNILVYLQAIESKDSSKIKNDKIRATINNKIREYKNFDIHFKKVKFHKTVVSKYENNHQVATITFGTSLEYLLYMDEKLQRKVQDRFHIEYIYILDSSKLDSSIAVTVSSPNCASSSINFKTKKCNYCGTYLKETVKRVWYCNNLVSN